MVVLGIITSLFIAIQDPVFQKFTARFAGGFLSEKTGGDIKVGRLLITPDFTVFLDNVVAKDMRENDLANVGSLRTRLNISDLLNGCIHLESVELRDTKANLVMYEGESKFNFAFLAEAFANSNDTIEKPERAPICIIVDRITVKDLDFVFWNQNKDQPEKTENHLMDYAHIALDTINLKIKDFYMFGDSIHTQIMSLSAKELSGLELKHFGADVVFCSSGIYLDGMKMETNNSQFDMDLHMLYDDVSAFKDFVNKVTFDATIRPMDIMLSDIGFFTSVMYKMPNRLTFEGRFSGPIEHFRVDDFKTSFGKMSSIEGSISMHPLNFYDGYHTLSIKRLRTTYDDLVDFYIPSKTQTIPMPKSLEPMGVARGTVSFRGSYMDFESRVHLLSNAGNVDLNVSRNRDAKGTNIFSGDINADGVNVGAIAHAERILGHLDLNTAFVAKFPQKGSIDLSMDGNVYRAELFGNSIDEIVLNGEMRDNRFNGIFTVNDKDLDLHFNGLIDFRDKKYPKLDFEAAISHANLSALKLMKKDSISEIGTHIVANLTGFDLDDLEGSLHIDNTVYRDSRGTYKMDRFDASILNDNLMMRRIDIDCDFFNFEMAGQMNFASLVPAFNEFGDYFVHFPQWQSKRDDFQKYQLDHDVDQDFVVSLILKDTKTLSRLFMPSLKIAKNTSLNGTFTSRTRQLNLTTRSKQVQIGDVTISNFEMKSFNTRSALFGILTIDDVAYTRISPTDTMRIGVNNFLLSAKMANDTIATRIAWDDEDEEDHNKAMIEGTYRPHETGGIINVGKFDLVVNDSLWNMSPNNFVDFNAGRVTLSNLQFSHNNQSLRVDGYLPMNPDDTLSVQLRSFDVSNFDLMFERISFDADGFISGDALLSNLKTAPMVLADLVIDKLGLNGDPMGDVVIESAWDNEKKSIDVDVEMFNDNKRMLDLTGSYYTARDTDNLDFTASMDSLRLNVLTPLVASFITRLQGYGNGSVDIKGSLKQPDINGRIHIDDGGCKVGYLNTFYTFSPTILIDNKSIKFEDMMLTDTLGNIAFVEGEIRHNYLKDFYLDLKLHPRDFLAMATGSKDNDSFYGSVVTYGLVDIKGPVNDIHLGIRARTRKGTSLTIPLNKTARVKDNDFIVFIEPEIETEEEEIPVEVEVKKKGNFAISLDVDATDDATLKIMLPGNIGTIDAKGAGNIKLNTATTEALTMYGNYTIASGRFQLTLMNLLTRNFTLKNGGTISWSGSPTDGRINATGAYSLKAPISGLGVQVDTTANNNVNVECLIRLNGALLNPSITFGMNLPNASEDITQTVFSLIDTTNHSIMESQVLSLLVLGSFADVGGGGGGMSLSNVLGTAMQLDVTSHTNVGLRYQSGSANSYDEYQLALRTELFENRLTIETNLGLMSSNNASNASNIVGEFDLYYKLSKDGRLQGHFYNHSNYNSNFNSFAIDRRAPYTQGLGLSYSKSFRRFRDLFKKKSVPNTRQPLIAPKKQTNN